MFALEKIQLLEGHFQYFFGIAYNLLGNIYDAEDAVQESICKFLEKKILFISKAKVKPYVARIVVNYCLDQLRKKRLFHVVQLEDVVDIKEKSSDTPSEELELCLEKLSPQDRLVIDLFYREDHSLKEIATLLGASLSSVKVRLHRARKTLKDIMKCHYSHTKEV